MLSYLSFDNYDSRHAVADDAGSVAFHSEEISGSVGLAF